VKSDALNLASFELKLSNPLPHHEKRFHIAEVVAYVFPAGGSA
jgi:hypothetical protein